MGELTVNIPKKVFLPCYHHLLNSDANIDILYGGRDSGKSQFIAQILVMECMRQPYFRCVLVRKVFNSIKESMWQAIKDVVVSWGLEPYFLFHSNPLEIHCVNGNRFTCRGMDNPGNLKSITNFNYSWVEEANQITLEDFILLITSLRYGKGKVKNYMSFNPETPGQYTDFWMYKTFYEDELDIYSSFSNTWTIEGEDKKTIQYKFTSTHTTYLDNKYCGADRIVFYNKLKNIDPYHYNVYTLGKWHNKTADDLFCYCYNAEKHIGRTALNPKLEVALSFDFNVNPITCGVYQSNADYIWGIESIKLANSDIYKLCDHISAKYSKYLLLVTGDATGKNTSALVQDGINYYTVIKSKLNLNKGQIKVPSVNPIIKENRVLVNAAFFNKKVILDKDNCKDLIYDCENVSVNEFGDIDKGSRTNPKKRSDQLDNWRYYLNTFHKDILSE